MRDMQPVGAKSAAGFAQEIRIRPAKEGDLAAVAALEATCFRHPWTMQGFAEAFGNERVVFLVAAMDGGKTADSSGRIAADDPGRIAGYALLYTAADEGEIPTIAVAQDCRRQGVGKKLLQALFDAGRAMGIRRIYLEVRQGNGAAIALYAANGFRKMGVRRNFYREPTEDADVMARTLLDEEDVC